MAGEKNYAVQATVTGLTRDQAADIGAGFMKVKNKIAPNARGTSASGRAEDLFQLPSNDKEEVRKIGKSEK